MADNMDDITEENDASADDALEEARQTDGPLPGQRPGAVDESDLPSLDPSEDSDVDPTEKYHESDDTIDPSSQIT